MSALGRLKSRSEGSSDAEPIDTARELQAERVGGSTIVSRRDGRRERLNSITERRFAVPAGFVREFKFPQLNGWDLHRMWSLIACMKPFASIAGEEQEISLRDLEAVSHRIPDSMSVALDRILDGCTVSASGHEMDGRKLFTSLRYEAGQGSPEPMKAKPGKILYRVEKATHYMLTDAWVYVPKAVWWRNHSRAGIDLLLNACAESLDVANPEFRVEITMDNVRRYSKGWTCGTLAAFRSSALMPAIEALNSAKPRDLDWWVDSYQTGGKTTSLVVVASSRAYAARKPSAREITAERKRENALIRRERAAKRQAIAARKAVKEAERAGV